MRGEGDSSERRRADYDEVPKEDTPVSTADEQSAYRFVSQAADGGDGDELESTAISSDGTRAVGVRIVRSSYPDAHGPGETVRIACGVVNTDTTPNQGVGGVDLTLEITRNGNTVDTLSPTTNDYGGVIVEYTAPSQEGEYRVTVSDGELDTRDEFRVGEHLKLNPTFDDHAITDDPMTVSLQATTGNEPRTGQDYDIEIRKPDDTTTTRTVTTDSDGFGTFDLVPEQTGDYDVRVQYQDGDSDSERIEVHEYVANIEEVNDYDITPGDTVAVAGYVLGPGGGPASNLDLEIVVTDDDDVQRDTIQTTTDTNGAVTFEWSTPDEYNGFDFGIRTSDGTNVEEDFLSVRFSESSDDSGLDFDIQGRSYGTTPGETVTFDVSASDDSGPLGGRTVDLIGLLGYRDTVPIVQDTVQLDGNGEATVDITIPEATPHRAELDIVGGIDYDDGRETTETGLTVRRYLVDESSSLVPGQTGTLTYTIENLVTGQAVEDAPVSVALLSQKLPGTTLGTDSARTDASGAATLEYDLPIDTGDSVRLADAGLGSFKNYYGYEGIGTPMDVTIDVSPAAPRPGETATLSYDVSGDVQAPVNAAVTVTVDKKSDDVTETVPLSTTLSPGETAQFTVPELNNATSTVIQARTLVIDDRKATVEESEFVSVEESDLAISASGDTINSGGQGQLSLSGSAFDTINIDGLWTDWEVAGQQSDGGSFTDEITENGRCEFSWPSQQDSAAPSLSLDVPSRYVGGTYVLTISASSPDDSTSTTATFDIQ